MQEGNEICRVIIFIYLVFHTTIVRTLYCGEVEEKGRKVVVGGYSIAFSLKRKLGKCSDVMWPSLSDSLIKQVFSREQR